MRLMVSGATATMRRYASYGAARQFLGVMLTPANGNAVDTAFSYGLPVCVDNSCYNYESFSQKDYIDLLHKVKNGPARPAFVVVPDQAPRPGEADNSHCHACTRHLFDEWFKVLWKQGLDRLPLAFVAQNGLRDVEDVPWDFIAALFVGGDDEFKLGDFVMMDLIPEAKARGKWVHVGRVNGARRLRHLVWADVDSVDGSSLSRFPDTYIGRRVAECWQFGQEVARTDALIAHLEASL